MLVYCKKFPKVGDRVVELRVREDTQPYLPEGIRIWLRGTVLRTWPAERTIDMVITPEPGDEANDPVGHVMSTIWAAHSRIVREVPDEI